MITRLTEHSAVSSNRCEVSKDGAKAYKRLKGNCAAMHGIGFGEMVLDRKLVQNRLAKLMSLCKEGACFGIRVAINCSTLRKAYWGEGGMVQLRPLGERWDSRAADLTCGVPWNWRATCRGCRERCVTRMARGRWQGHPCVHGCRLGRVQGEEAERERWDDNRWSSTQVSIATPSVKSEFHALCEELPSHSDCKRFWETSGGASSQISTWPTLQGSRCLGEWGSATRHIVVLYVCVQQEVMWRRIEINRILGDRNPADARTKPRRACRRD